jgi:hypothetical protein
MIEVKLKVKDAAPILRYYLKAVSSNTRRVFLRFYPLGHGVELVGQTWNGGSRDWYYDCYPWRALGSVSEFGQAYLRVYLELNNLLLNTGSYQGKETTPIFSLAEDLAGRLLCGIPDAPLMPPGLVMDWLQENGYEKEWGQMREVFGGCLIGG